MAIQQELSVPVPEEEIAEVYEDEARSRPWAAIASMVLAVAVIFVGYQWHQATSREQALANQAQALRAEVESMRLRAEDAKRQVAEFQQRAAALATEKTALEERVATMEKATRDRQTAAAKPAPAVTKTSADTAKKRR
jgi:uncharacterized protein YlxW (UPF0749 family)